MSSDVNALEGQVASAMQQQRWDDALDALRQLIEIDPDRLNYTARFAHLLDGLGHTQHAIDIYRRFLDRNPGAATAHFNVAGLYKKLQQDALALAALDEAIRLRIDHVEEVYLNRGVLFAETHRPEKARACYEKALSLAPDYVSALFNLAGLLEEGRQAASPGYLQSHPRDTAGLRGSPVEAGLRGEDESGPRGARRAPGEGRCRNDV